MTINDLEFLPPIPRESHAKALLQKAREDIVKQIREREVAVREYENYIQECRLLLSELAGKLTDLDKAIEAL